MLLAMAELLRNQGALVVILQSIAMQRQPLQRAHHQAVGDAALLELSQNVG